MYYNTGSYGYFYDNQPKYNKRTHPKTQLDLYKTKLCPNYLEVSFHLIQNGQCSKGDKCQFAHGKNELREKPNLKKTKICENYVKGSTVW